MHPIGGTSFHSPLMSPETILLLRIRLIFSNSLAPCYTSSVSTVLFDFGKGIRKCGGVFTQLVLVCMIARMCVELNCRISDTTNFSSGKTVVNCIILHRFFSKNDVSLKGS